MLDIKGLTVNYGRVRALDNLTLSVGEREIVALVGANGAGKSTLLKAVSGLVPCVSGDIMFCDRRANGLPVHEILKLGIAHVPEGRRVFPDLTVRENLLLGAFSRRDKEVAADIERIYEYFPVLGERQAQLAGTLSGGEQQMLAIGRGLMSRPRLMMLDEPMLGLAPVMVDRVAEIVVQLRDLGIAVLLAEQNTNVALSVADRGYVVETGRITASGPAQKLAADPTVREAYLGLAGT
ncbi:MAG TPA: ABC transporter ATP-binding protein [Firmicutes bacterium]|nr:ABC transporter ATP-binding protein [Bacillota bacterium]